MVEFEAALTFSLVSPRLSSSQCEQLVTKLEAWHKADEQTVQYWKLLEGKSNIMASKQAKETNLELKVKMRSNLKKDIAARKIQRAWRNYLHRKYFDGKVDGFKSKPISPAESS